MGPSRHLRNTQFFSNPNLDPVVWDTKLAAYLLFICSLIVSIFIIMGQAELSGEIFSKAYLHGWSLLFYTLFAHLSGIFVVLYFCSSPSHKEWLFFLALYVLTRYIATIWGWREFSLGFSLTTLGLSCFIMCLYRVIVSCFKPQTLYNIRLRWLLIVVVLFIYTGTPSLELTTYYHPLTFDFFALRFDALLIPTLIPKIVLGINQIPGGAKFMNLVYDLMFCIPLCLGMHQLYGRPVYIASVSLVWVVMAIFSVISYNLYSLVGPYFVFGADFFKIEVDKLSPILLAAAPTPRNAMPSMHFGWLLASVIIWWRSGCSSLWAIFLLADTICLAVSTLYLGQHYLIDLIVAVPVTLASIALATTGVSFFHFSRIYTVVAGFVTWAIWIALLRTELGFFIDYPVAAKALVVFTLIVVGWQSYWISCLKYAPVSVK